MAKLDISAPWIIFYREVEELFKHDSEVHVVFDEKNNKISLYVEDYEKADALTTLLPTEKKFGNVTLTLTVIASNNKPNAILSGIPYADLFENALFRNDAFVFAKTIPYIFTNDLTYVVFKNKVVQYYNDDLGDIYGQCSTLYQNIAKDVFGSIEGVFFCTDKPEGEKKLGTPLGEWP